MRSLRKVADVLLKYPQRTVMIEGFTDDRGSEERNKALSERRSPLGCHSQRAAWHGNRRRAHHRAWLRRRISDRRQCHRGRPSTQSAR
jgi:hypothetical protein